MCQSVIYCLCPNFIQRYAKSSGMLDTSNETIAQANITVDIGSSMTFFSTEQSENKIITQSWMSGNETGPGLFVLC